MTNSRTPAVDVLTPIRLAGSEQAAALVDLLAAAFLHSELGPWLIPDVATRAKVYPPYFAILVEQALAEGWADAIPVADTDPGQDGWVGEPGALAAAAVWFSYDGSAEPGSPPDYDTRLAEVTGAALPRFQALDAVMHDRHPRHTAHHYLAFAAVHPALQRRGLGSVLLRHHHADLDRQGMPAYLEATGVTNRALYQRHGYQPSTPYHLTEESPALHPMWRDPQQAAPLG